MLFLLIACAAGVYLWQHAPGILYVFGGIGLLWLVYAIPVVLFLGLSKFVNALPAWRWLTAESLVPDWLSWLSFRHDRIFYGFLVVGTLALCLEYALRVH